MQTASSWLFAAILIFCPLAFGTVEHWSITIMEIVVPLALLLYLVGCHRRGKWYGVPGLVPLACLLGYLLIQLIPLPGNLLRILSPAAYEIYQPVLDVSAGQLWAPLSVNRQATISEFCRYFTYTCFYILTIQLTASYSRLRRVLLVVIGLASTIAFLAIIQKFTSPDKIFWFRESPGSYPIGPWIYRNHYAGFMAMLLPLAVALFLHYRPRIRYDISWREKLLSVFTLPHANLHILLGFGALLMALSILISLSRGGIVSATLSLLIFVILMARWGERRSGVLGVLAFTSVVLLAMAWFGWQPVIARFNQITNANNEIFDGRLLIWQDSWPIIRDYWLCGAGFGSFIHIFPLYRQAMPGGSIIDHAHNDYIELFTDGGIISMVLVACFFIVLFRSAFRTIGTRRDDFSKYLFYACLCGIAALLIHSITDFNMHNGANGLYFFFICGLLVSAANTRRRAQSKKSFLTPGRAPLLALGLPVLMLALMSFLINKGIAQARYNFRPVNNVYLNRNIPEQRLLAWQAQTSAAQGADPFESRYPFMAGNIRSFLFDYEGAKEQYLRALSLEPTNASQLLQAGFYLGQKEKALGMGLLKAAARIERRNPKTYKDLGHWLLQQGETERGLDSLRQAMSMEAGQSSFSEYIALALINDLDLTVMDKVLPQQTAPYLQFAALLNKEGKSEMAGHYYKKSMEFLNAETKTSPWFFHTAYSFFMGHKKYEDALAVIRKGLDYHPDDARMHVLAGDVYRMLDINYRAREQYRQALVIAPGDGRVIRALEELN